MNGLKGEGGMPYYRWTGVDITGTTHKGSSAAQSSKHLDAQLFKRGIALLKNKQVRMPFFARSIRLSQKIQLYQQLATLIFAGVRLPDALDIVADQLNHPRLQDIIYAIGAAVRSGVALSTAIKKYPSVFDPLVVQMITISQESGNLAKGFDVACTYLETQHSFKTSLRSALAIPTLTFVCLIGIAGIIFGAIIPRFGDIFSSMKQELPALTKTMISISLFIRSWYMMGLLLGLGALFGVLRKSMRSHAGKHIFDRLYLSFPFIGMIVQYHFWGYCLQSLALLLQGGMPLVPALHIMYDVCDNTIFKQCLAVLHAEVTAGSLLSNAMAGFPLGTVSQEAISMVRVGEESGNLAKLLEHASYIYHDKLKRQLKIMTFVIQPVCILVLGLLVALLIFAVYMPVINLSQMI